MEGQCDDDTTWIHPQLNNQYCNIVHTDHSEGGPVLPMGLSNAQPSSMAFVVKDFQPHSGFRCSYNKAGPCQQTSSHIHKHSVNSGRP